MITTRFLTHNEYASYGNWMKQQDAETLKLFFGVPANESYIDRLVEKILSEPSKHEFLVAEENGKRIGVIHISEFKGCVEFGITVDKAMRGKGVGSQMLGEAILWARNRNFKELFMHCLSWNQPIVHLCHKYGLKTTSMYGETDVQVALPPPSIESLMKENFIKQKQIWGLVLEGVGVSN